MTSGVHTFKSFPEFSKLTLADRDVFEEIIMQYPPIADISFAGLINWWDAFDGLAIASLNNNLVISYWLPGLEKYSGLSLVGTHKIDQSLCTIFDYQKDRGEQAWLTNVPEFVISNVQFPELFTFKEQRALNEYIFSLEKFYPLSSMATHHKWRVRRFIDLVGGEGATSVRSIDLSASSSRQLLLGKVDEWRGKGALNTTFKLEHDAIRSAIGQAESIGMENVCLFVGGELQAFCLYQIGSDGRHVLISHGRTGSEIPHTFSYALHAFSKWFIDQGITKANLEADLGYLGMRMVKLAMGPSNFFRKYSIEPVQGVNA